MQEIMLPARINLLGNPSDANEGAHQTISAAINVWGGVRVGASDRLELSFHEGRNPGGRVLSSIQVPDFQALEFGQGFDLQVAAIRALLSHSQEFREKARGQSFPRLEFWTEIPRQSGLGGSTVLVLLTLVALVSFYQLNRRRHNEYVLAELAQRAEEKDLGITCGFADRYVPLFGDVAYIDYRGKLFHLPIKEEPYCAYERLGRWVEDLPLVMCSTGLQHDSGGVHGPMRARYLDEYRQWKGDYQNAPPMIRLMKNVGDTAWKGKIALIEGDFARFGELMNENHRLVDEMMRYCGFTEGVGEANNRIIRAGLSAGALGAKLTGAGGGGSVFMLVEPGREEEMAQALTRALAIHGYDRGEIFIPSLVRRGMVVIGAKA